MSVVVEQSESNRPTLKHFLSLLCWNIDGLDKVALFERTEEVYKYINKSLPNVIFLQEVIPDTESILKEKCINYIFISGRGEQSRSSYYTAILLKKDGLNKIKSTHIIPYVNSKMRRNLLLVKANIKGRKFCFMTTHCESNETNSSVRQEQLNTAFQSIRSIKYNRTVIFGGDLNIRESEIQNMKGVPDNIIDIWQATGSNPEHQYSWDMTKNDNYGRFYSQYRFDRLYLRHSKHPVIKPTLFELTGTQRLPKCRRFVSDHWALHVTFDLI